MKGVLPGRQFIRAWRDALRFYRRQDDASRIVFYSEDRSYEKYLGPIIRALVEQEGEQLCYLSSDAADPILKQNETVLRGGRDKPITSYYVGAGSARTFAFQTLRANILVMTMPDLETFHIKRSTVHPVHYAYVHHSMVSTHMVYRGEAFDHFDSIFCVGPHHVEEIRAWEKLNGLPSKRLFEHGYAVLDWLLAAGREPGAQQLAGAPLNVLLAPSWGADSIIERGAEPLIQALLGAGYHVVVRPHSMTARNSSAKLDQLSRSFRGAGQFVLDADTTTLRALLDADVMISDWSGAAMEFAFGLGRPVLFLDVPRKVNNPRWTEINITPLEDFYRNEVGTILDCRRPADAPAMIERLWKSSGAIAERANILRAKYVFNPGDSASHGAKIIADLARDRRR